MIFDSRGRRTDMSAAEVCQAMGWESVSTVMVACAGERLKGLDWEGMLGAGGGGGCGGGGARGEEEECVLLPVAPSAKKRGGGKGGRGGRLPK